MPLVPQLKNEVIMVINLQDQKVQRSLAMDHLGEERNLSSVTNVGVGDTDGVNVLPQET